ncbi:MAG: biopolymer transporter ExbD [Spirochaetaceae bacterium]|jgi:biopolymer transport protein ExbD|nr:biopolymer transporter ExbD [Spirochaetaceae bacterium]
MKTFGSGPSRSREINVTSLIDVIFMLVIFFMIGSTFEKPALAVSLPTASSGEPAGQPLHTVSLDAAGQLYLEGEPIEEAALRRRLAAYREAEPDMRIALDCDGTLAFQRVTDIMDLLRAEGVRHVAIRHAFPR